MPSDRIIHWNVTTNKTGSTLQGKVNYRSLLSYVTICRHFICIFSNTHKLPAQATTRHRYKN